MFENFDEAARDAVTTARQDCLRLRSGAVPPEHLLLSLTRDPESIACRALSVLNIRADNLQAEIDRLKVGQPTGATTTALLSYHDISFTDDLRKIFQRANEYRLFFGRDHVRTEHLLTAILDVKPDTAIKLLEELGANLGFLRRQLMNLMAKEDVLLADAPGVQSTVVSGLNELIKERYDALQSLNQLSALTGHRLPKLPERSDIVLMVFLAYLPDFFLTQVAYQRYLLEQTLKLLDRRAGSTDKEISASIVSSAAQNLRREVRATIEYVWSHEYRSKMPDEAEHDLIGSIIEDLWWAHSEEVALDGVFDEAMDDYRRKHVLSLQKRKLEIEQRLAKLRTRLEETIKQCFLSRSVSA